MPNAKIHAGETPLLTVTLKHADGTTFAITTGWTVQAALKRRINGRAVQVTSTIAVLEATVGSDWPNGVIVFEIPQADTKVLRARRHDLEILVEYSPGKDRRWTIKDIDVIGGTLPLSS